MCNSNNSVNFCNNYSKFFVTMYEKFERGTLGSKPWFSICGPISWISVTISCTIPSELSVTIVVTITTQTRARLGSGNNNVNFCNNFSKFFVTMNENSPIFVVTLFKDFQCNLSIIRSYHSGYTGSHPNSEVKHGWVYLVPHQFYYPSEVAKDKSSKCIPVTMYIWECHFKRHSLPLHRNAFRNATQRMYFGMYFVTITWI